jgi:DNA polymerase-3 subunit gamma/tau
VEDWPTTAKIGGAPAHDDAPPLTDEDVPYDPEFDGPPARPMHEGFDPGDEPDLDTDSLTVKQTSEEQALESLKQSFDLEKIAEKGS